MHAAANVPSCWERAIAYGDGLFESILVLDGIAPLWQFHRQRLQHSLARLRIHCNLAALEKSFLSIAAKEPHALVKIIVARSGGSRGYSARQSDEYSVQIKSYPLPQYSHTRMTEGVRLQVCHQRLSHNPSLAGIKHLNRLEQVLASSELDRGIADEGLMLDNTGSVIEGTISNIFILRDGVLLTPRLDHCGIAGVMRSFIQQKVTPELSLTIRETRLTLTDVLTGEAVFVCNSIFGVWPVRSVGVSQLSMRPKLIGKIWQSLSVLGYARLYG